MKKRLLASILALTLAVGMMTACGNETPAEEAGQEVEEEAPTETAEEAPAGELDGTGLSFQVNLKTLNSEYWNTVKKGCDAAAEKYGCEVTVTGPDAESEIGQQVTQIGDALSQSPDAIIVAACDTDAVAGALQDVSGQLPIIFIDQDVDFEGKTAFIGTRNVDAAKQGGQYVGENIGEDAKVAIIYGQEGELTSNDRTNGYKEGLAEYGIEPITEISGKNVSDQSKAAMEDILTRFNNEVDAVLCMNDDTAIGALSACQDAGVADKVTIIGFDGNNSALELVASGDLTATIAQQPYLEGYMAIENAIRVCRGETIEKEIPIETVFVTSENVADYMEKLASQG